MIKGVIFDLDGVLTDTAEYHFQAWERLANEEGIPFTREDNEALRGVSRRQSLELLLKGKKISEQEAEKMMERKNSYYRKLIEKMTSEDVFPGVMELLKYLKKKGIKTGIASASKNTQKVMDRLGITSLFDVIADGYSVERSKPKPDIFLYVAKKFGCEPDDCVVVEDAEAGVQAAHAAGMKCIGIGKAAKGAEVVLGRVGEIFPVEFTKIVQG